MLGKRLSERYALRPLDASRAITILEDALEAHARHLVEVRARGADSVACLVVRADEATARACRALGLRVRRGGSGVFGLRGADAARVFPDLPPHQGAWLAAPCAPRETKVLLLAGGTALLSIVTRDGRATVTAVPAAVTA